MNLYALIYTSLFRLWEFYKYIFDPVSCGVRVIVLHNQKILLVKHSYRVGYFFPGGGLKKKEAITDGAIREVFEETGIKIKSPRLFAAYRKPLYSDIKLIYISDSIEGSAKIQIDKKEIIHADWFDLNNLPSDINPIIKKHLEKYLNH